MPTPPHQVLEAAGELRLHLDDAPHWRVAWREPDWLGPISFLIQHQGISHSSDAAANPTHRLEPRRQGFDGRDALGHYHGVTLSWPAAPLPVRASVRAYADVSVLVFRIEAATALAALGTGRFAVPSVAWPVARPAQRRVGGVPAATRSYGHQYTEFALPVSGDAGCTGFVFAPHRPHVVEPLLLIAPDGRTLLLAPLDRFHEQIIAPPDPDEPAGDGLRCGWHGDLADVPASFATELAVWAAETPRRALDEWAGYLRRGAATQRPGRYVDDLLGKLSYWTDNGAVYYYRTERDCDYLTTLERVLGDLDARDIPVGSLQLDSWFYPHQHLRPVGPEGAPIVPPSGMLEWAPRRDLFPDGFEVLSARVSGRPLTFHSRHFSSASPYFEAHAAWRDGDYAHPVDGELYALLLEQAARWGAITYEQDWMVESFLGVRGLRAAPDRARAWQEQLDGAARDRGLTLQWCMASPADFLQSVTLRQVASIRTSGDYRYLFDNGLNWVWFLHTNALARALGLHPFKDVFLTHGPTELSPGEPYAEVEALLASLSSGPVAIGDQLGHSDRELVLRCCREDGVLVKPDVPLAALDRCFLANSFLEPALLVGETHSLHPAGRWLYVTSFNAYRGKQPISGRVNLADLGALCPTGPALVYDWRRHTWSRCAAHEGWDLTLAFQEWDYRVVCPLLPGDVTIFGDVRKYATVGDRRVAHITQRDGALHFTVFGMPRTCVEVHGYAATKPGAMTQWSPGGTRPLAETTLGTNRPDTWGWDDATGLWHVRLGIGSLGHVRVTLTTG